MGTHLDICEQVLELVGDRAEAQVRVTGGREALTRFANSFIHQNVAEDGLWVNLKVAIDGKVASATTTRTGPDPLKRLAEDAIEAARLRPADPDWPGTAPAADVTDPGHYDRTTAQAGPEERARLVQAFVEQGPGLRAAGYVSTDGGSVAVATSAGQRAEGRATRATLDGIHQTAASAGSAHQSSTRLAELDGTATGQRAARKAESSAEADDLEPGRYEVVLQPECVATIVAFLTGYGFNAKAVIEGQSFVKLGEKQFDTSIDLWDDAFDPRAMGLGFDAEGTPKRRVDLIDDGVSASLAHDRRTAGKMDTGSTGHAVPGSEVWGAFPTNLFMGTGGRTEEELVESVERGLLVTQFNYCRVLDPKTQVVTGLTRNGTFLIENGEATRAIKNLRFTQSFVEALGSGKVVGIGSESRFADSEFGPGYIVVPSLHLAEWNFTGGARG